MKFKLLEIESVNRSFSRLIGSGFCANGKPDTVIGLTIYINNLTKVQLPELIKMSALYPNTFKLINYNERELSLHVDLRGLNVQDIKYPQELEVFVHYIVNLKEHFQYYRTRWQSEYGISFEQPVVMGVINVTPDSFSDGGLHIQPDKAVKAALSLVKQGAHIIDIGGESSRPGAAPVSTDIEMARIIPVIEELSRQSTVVISVDTYKAAVAEAALNAGANWINDISALRMDPDMISLCRERDVPVVLMHMQGTPRTMQQDPHYESVIDELVLFFEERIETLNSNGINKIILDPGIGFGKKLEHNLEILGNLRIFKQFGYPLLVGTSRKSFIGALTGRPVNDRIAGTLSSVIWSVLHGVNIVRVHDVAESVDTLKIINSIYNNVKEA